MLTLDNVTKVYKTGTFGGESLPAVRGASFEIRPGEVTSLIGESGSGKSTLGKMILRLTPVTSGTISFEGTDVAGLKGKRLREYYRHVQGVFQDPFSSYNPVFRADRVFATIKRSYFPSVSNSEWHGRVEASLESVGLNPVDVLDKFTHQLSGGQLQRILIARALLLEIKILVADEIISMIDASTRVDVLNLLANLKSRGLGVLFITHDLSLGNYISERTIILRRGVMVEMGATQKVFDNPQHAYTRHLLLQGQIETLVKAWAAEAALERDGQRAARLLYFAGRLASERLDQKPQAIELFERAAGSDQAAPSVRRAALRELFRLYESVGSLDRAVATGASAAQEVGGRVGTRIGRHGGHLGGRETPGPLLEEQLAPAREHARAEGASRRGRARTLRRLAPYRHVPADPRGGPAARGDRPGRAHRLPEL